MAVVTCNTVTIETLDGARVKPQVHNVSWDPIAAEKGEYRHFMQKEIHEQARALTDTLAGRVDFVNGKIRLPDPKLISQKTCQQDRTDLYHRLRHGCLCRHGGKYLIEKIARIPVEVVIASEFRYSDPILDDKTVVLAISQSGETADTLAAMEEGRRKARSSGVLSMRSAHRRCAWRMDSSRCKRDLKSASLRRRLSPPHWLTSTCWRFCWQTCAA